MRRAALVDCRNVYDPREVKSFGFAHAGVGRSAEAAAPWVMEEIVVHDEEAADLR